MTFLRIVIPLYLFVEHDLRANASRLSRGKPGTPLFRIMLQSPFPGHPTSNSINLKPRLGPRFGPRRARRCPTSMSCQGDRAGWHRGRSAPYSSCDPLAFGSRIQIRESDFPAAGALRPHAKNGVNPGLGIARLARTETPLFGVQCSDHAADIGRAR